MDLSDKLNESIKLLYSSRNWSRANYEPRYLKAVRILKNEMNKGDPNATYFLARTYFGEQYIPHVRVGGKYENDELGYQLLRKSFELRSPFAIVNGALRVSGGIPDEAIGALIDEEPMAFSQAIAQIQEWAQHGHFFSNYILANFYYWGDNQLFGDQNHRYDLALQYYSKAKEYGMVVDNFAYNILHTVIHLENEEEITRWCKIISGSGYRNESIIMMMERDANPWADAIISLYGLGETIDIPKAYKICKRHKIKSLLANFHKTGFFSAPTYNYPQKR